MSSKRNRYLFSLPALLLGTAFLPQFPTAQRSQPDSKQVTVLLDQANSQAAQLKLDAIQSFAHSNVTWESHSDKITSIKSDLNCIAQTVATTNVRAI